MATLTISLDDEIKKLIINSAKTKGMTISNFIRTSCIKEITLIDKPKRVENEVIKHD